ncbi:MAG: MATE family efflux transporter [Bacteroides sp.]|nr:MATE family efflux transporter [Bacteroides sp.]MCM1414275.1 MATE family efflux transporter [Bacteroides sp.]
MSFDHQNNNATNGNVERLATGKIGRLLWDYSLPAVTGMLIMSLYNVIDRIFIGQGVGADAITGLTITFPVMNISAAIGVLIGAGASAKVSILLGAHDKEGAELTLGNSLTLIITNAIIYLTIMRLFLDEILLLFGADAESLPYAHDFMAYILPGMLVMNIGFSLNNVMRASGYPVKAMITMIIGAGCNVVLAPIFIFALDMGIKGAAIATDLSMCVFSTYVLVHFCRRSSTIHFKRECFRLKRHIVMGIIGIGAAPSLVNLASCFINIILNNRLHEYGGNSAVAAAGIFSTYTSLLCMTVVGMCQGMQPIVGYNYGAGRYDRLMRAYWTTVGAATIIILAGAIFGLGWPGLIARAFTTDTELISVTSKAFSRAMLLFFVVGFQIVSTTFFQSIGKVAQSIFLSLSRQVIFLIPLLIVFSKLWALDGVWYSFPVSDMLATVVTAIMIWWQIKQIHRVMAR